MAVLLVGLGNIGEQYRYTRHNIGFLVVDELVRRQGVSFHMDRLAQVAMFVDGNCKVYLIKPTTYMNHSGKAVAYWLHKLQLSTAQGLVVVDDIALPFGKLRLRAHGSPGGHNGLRSIADALNGDHYPRLRVGIGSDFPQGGLAEFVLSTFSNEEQAQLPRYINQAADLVHTWCTQGMDHAMNHANK